MPRVRRQQLLSGLSWLGALLFCAIHRLCQESTDAGARAAPQELSRRVGAGAQRAALADEVPNAAAAAAESSSSFAAVASLVEAATRLAARSADAADQPALLEPILAPMLAIINAAVLGTASPVRAAFALDAIATVLRFMRPSRASAADGAAVAAPPDAAASPALRVIETLWPALTAVACGPPATHEVVVAALSAVLSECITAAGPDRSALLSHVVSVLCALYDKTGAAAPLDALADVASSSGDVPADAAAPLHAALAPIVAAATLRVADAPVATAAVLTLATRFALFHPAALLSGPALSPTLELAAACCAARERVVVQAALMLLQHLVTPNSFLKGQLAVAGAAPSEALGAILAARARPLVSRLLLSLATTCPQDSWRAVGRLFYGMLTSPALGAPALHALRCELTARSSSSSDGVAPGAEAEVCSRSSLSSVDTARFAEYCGAAAELGERRFAALVADVAAVAHGMEASDTLLVYVLPAG
jgi:hypothetical protein